MAPFAAQRVDEFPNWIIHDLTSLFLATGFSTLWTIIEGKDFAAMVLPGVGFATALLFVAMLAYPMANSFKLSREFAQVIAEETAPAQVVGQEVLASDLGNLPIHCAFYSNGIYTVETKRISDLARHLDCDEQVFALANAKRFDELPPAIRERIEIIATTHASRRDVALISNHPPSAGEE